MTTSIIAAVSQNNVIGLNNDLPWNITEDLQYFKFITANSSVIMGRKTYDSIGFLLPKRENIIVTRQHNYAIKGAKIANSLSEALEISSKNKIFIIGGEKIYREAINLVDFLYITLIEKDFIGDAFFPEIDPLLWELIQENKEVSEKDNIPFRFQIYKKIK